MAWLSTALTAAAPYAQAAGSTALNALGTLAGNPQSGASLGASLGGLGGFNGAVMGSNIGGGIASGIGAASALGGGGAAPPPPAMPMGQPLTPIAALGASQPQQQQSDWYVNPQGRLARRFLA